MGKGIKKIALIASILYAFSPLIIQSIRMPYHTSPIPLFTLLYFFSLFQWMRSRRIYFPLTVMFLAILYNFELATVMLLGPLVILLVHGFWKKEEWVASLTKKDISLALLLGFIPLIPVILYDTTHGFKQTIVYALWLVFTASRAFLTLFSGDTSNGNLNQMLQFLYQRLGQLIFLPSFFLALIIFLAGLFTLIKESVLDYRSKGGNQFHNTSYVVACYITGCFYCQ